MKRQFVLLLAGSSILAAHLLDAQVQAKACVAAHYKLVALPLRPTQINDSGQVSGTVPSRKAAVWSEHGGLKQATVPAGFTIAEGIALNADGHMIGLATNQDGSKRQAFTFINGKTELLPGEQSKATALNDNDEIAGESSLPGKAATNPVLWRKRKPVDLGACCGGTAFALNVHAQVVGESYDSEGRYHAFLWDNAQGMKTLDTEDDYSSAVAINKAGHVVVQAFPRTYLYEEGKLNPLLLAPKYPSLPRALNNCDVIVGSYGKHSDDSKAFVWDKARGFLDLNNLVLGLSGWKLEVATSINNRGEIVGWGDFKGAEDQGFLLRPLD
jgi:probable HAF family extracellular repeat protein